MKKILEKYKRFKINYCKIITNIVKYSHEMIPEKEVARWGHHFIRKIPVMPGDRQGKDRDRISGSS